MIDGRIYFSGGYYVERDGRGPVGTLYVYDPRTNRWTRKACVRSGAKGVTGVMKGQLYVVNTCSEAVPGEEWIDECGGVEEGAPGISNFSRYNPAADRWVRLPSPKGEYHMGAVVDKKLYVTNGKNLEAYNPVTTTKASGWPAPDRGGRRDPTRQQPQYIP